MDRSDCLLVSGTTANEASTDLLAAHRDDGFIESGRSIIPRRGIGDWRRSRIKIGLVALPAEVNCKPGQSSLECPQFRLAPSRPHFDTAISFLAFGGPFHLGVERQLGVLLCASPRTDRGSAMLHM